MTHCRFIRLQEEGILALSKEIICFPKGILASLKETIRCPKEEWLLITFWDRRTAKMLICTKHSIALRWSHTFSGKLDTEFFANNFSINTKRAVLDSSPKWFKLIMGVHYEKITHLPVDGVKRLGSFEISQVFTC